MAYDNAVKLNKKLPEKRHEDRQAGIEWMKYFMKRPPRLSLRKPENTSFGTASAFNKHIGDTFCNNYADVLDKYKFSQVVFGILTHVSVDVINYARENGMILLPLPLSATRKMQPLHKTG